MKPITKADIDSAVEAKRAELEAFLTHEQLCILCPRDTKERTFRIDIESYIGSGDTISIDYFKSFINKAEQDGASDIVIENDAYSGDGCDIKVYYEVKRAINDNEYNEQIQHYKSNYIRDEVAKVSQELNMRKEEYSQYQRLKMKYENP